MRASGIEEGGAGGETRVGARTVGGVGLRFGARLRLPDAGAALVRAVDSARSAEASAQVAFEVGSRTAADYLGAVRARFSAERDLSRARYNYLLGLLRLREAAGVVTVTDLENLNRTLQ